MNNSLFATGDSQPSGPVVCLGRTFENDSDRLAYYRNALLAALPDLKKIPGFPSGDDATILALSDPPYFTACPNPFLADVTAHFSKTEQLDDSFARDPFASDVSEGRGDTLYNAHGYHTKVPHKALMRYILHYTAPNDIVFDGFCGTGMTGLASLLCSNKAAVESLGYRVDANGTIRNSEGDTISKVGSRTAILSDLSPIACFIASNYSTPQIPATFSSHCQAALSAIETALGWMLCTLHNPKPKDIDLALKALASPKYAEELRKVANGRVHYTIWSDVFSCQQCGAHITYWTEAVDVDNGKVRESFPCPKCNASLSKAFS